MTWQLATPVETSLSEHEGLVVVTDPSVANAITPWGVVAGPTSLSVTVAVQVVGTSTATGDGMQTTAVVVVRWVTVRVSPPEPQGVVTWLLLESPEYVAPQ